MRSAEFNKRSAVRTRTANVEHRTLNLELEWRLWSGGAVLLAAAGVMGVGLVKSYSRGAWVGAAVGLHTWLSGVSSPGSTDRSEHAKSGSAEQAG